MGSLGGEGIIPHDENDVEILRAEVCEEAFFAVVEVVRGSIGGGGGGDLVLVGRSDSASILLRSIITIVIALIVVD